ncbi:TetR/AcrR family transcriptional regulator [Clostridium sp. HBUAS56010]|uniref:TetR/AcrR family transcriptional regulator n=1 Tax=Clostridium sp. HBUAS56010 TaxID=2571127 RepID=UPI001178C16A|nr:TetR/AcrR family transcriptional regulator [Clostridium sp. HBUAS56010]
MINNNLNPSYKVKYLKHNERLSDLILDRAEQLFISNGINKTSFSSIASVCGVTRSTLYKYYKSKEDLLWSIHHKKMQFLSQRLYRNFSKSRHSTYDRFYSYYRFIRETYQDDPEWFQFFNVFYDSWQYETSKRSSDYYKKTFHNGDFGSKDMVRFLCKNFHDGSVKKDLDPEMTAVAFTYAGFHIASGLMQTAQTLPVKYGLNTVEILDTTFQLLLSGLKG